jgi:hypothetical protein
MSSDPSGKGSQFSIEMAAAYYHPDFPKGDYFMQMIGDTLFVNVPPPKTRGYVVIATLPVGQWTQLDDGTGNKLDVAVMRTEAGELKGAWL